MLIVSGSYVKRNIGAGKYSWAGKIDTKCLYQYREPVSPHLAARLAPELVSPIVFRTRRDAHVARLFRNSQRPTSTF